MTPRFQRTQHRTPWLCLNRGGHTGMCELRDSDQRRAIANTVVTSGVLFAAARRDGFRQVPPVAVHIGMVNSSASLGMPLLSDRGDAPEPGHDDRSGDGQRQHDSGCDTAAPALVAKQAALGGPMGWLLAHGSRCPSRIESMWLATRLRTCSVTSRAFSSRSTRPRAIAHTSWLSQNTPADQLSLSLATLKCLPLSSLSGHSSSRRRFRLSDPVRPAIDD